MESIGETSETFEAEASDKKVFTTLFDADELEAMNDEQLLEILKQSWGYESDEDIELIGVLNKITNKSKDKLHIYFSLDELKNKKWEDIVYPVKDFNGTGWVYVCPQNNLDQSFTHGSIIKAKVHLADPFYREKHDNPFKLNADLNSLTKLTKLPEHLLKESIDNNSGYIEQWIIDYSSLIYADKIKHKAEASIEKTIEKQKELENKLLDTQNEYENAKNKVSKNIELLQKQDTIITNKKQEISTQQKLFEEAKLELKEIYESKEDIVSKLNKFIENKATLLKDLGILDEQSVREITGTFNEVEDTREGYKLKEDFDNVPQAIAHIQAYLYNKGIMYRRDVLENFFTLLSTRDLIILAGDSGSGKTNLVKSFADAIGGKSFIIPVKPNWTGSEDLLGYYNPIEQSFLSTLFLDSLIEARNNPNVPYFICLDEMNLARVEYYFADFLSLLEERDHQPEVHLYSQSESSHLVSETKNFLALLDEAKQSLGKEDLNSFVEVLQDEELNRKLHELCGFKDGDSLLKYHTRLRKAFASYLNNPAIIEIPNNVFFIGAINIDETTHYLSPKILDRAHIMRFTNPLLQDWGEIADEIEEDADLDISKPVLFRSDDFGKRVSYPKFDANGELEKHLIDITKNHLLPLGVEFGLRSIRQSRNYLDKYQEHFDIDTDVVLNHVVRQKILPKMMFDGTKKIDETTERKDVLENLRSYLIQVLNNTEIHEQDNAIQDLETTLKNAEINDWVVNYWFK